MENCAVEVFYYKETLLESHSLVLKILVVKNQIKKQYSREKLFEDQGLSKSILCLRLSGILLFGQHALPPYLI